jgi:hypothetical protein
MFLLPRVQIMLLMLLPVLSLLMLLPSAEGIWHLTQGRLSLLK